MAEYKDVSSLEVVAYKGGNKDFDDGVQFILEKLDAIPTADVFEHKTIEKAKAEIIDRIEHLRGEWTKMSESNIDMKYTQFYSGRADGIETGKRIVDMVLDNALKGGK